MFKTPRVYPPPKRPILCRVGPNQTLLTLFIYSSQACTTGKIWSGKKHCQPTTINVKSKTEEKQCLEHACYVYMRYSDIAEMRHIAML